MGGFSPSVSSLPPPPQQCRQSSPPLRSTSWPATSLCPAPIRQKHFENRKEGGPSWINLNKPLPQDSVCERIRKSYGLDWRLGKVHGMFLGVSGQSPVGHFPIWRVGAWTSVCITVSLPLRQYNVREGLSVTENLNQSKHFY